MDSSRQQPRPASPEKQLGAFIAKFEPEIRASIREARQLVCGLLPAAHQLVYDNYNFLVIGYSPTERPSDAIVSLAADANGVRLCFLQGSNLPDPSVILLGSGTRNRYVRLVAPRTLLRPEVQSIIRAALEQAKVPMPQSGRGSVIIRSVSQKQRPRKRQPASGGKPKRTPTARRARS